MTSCSTALSAHINSHALSILSLRSLYETIRENRSLSYNWETTELYPGQVQSSHSVNKHVLAEDFTIFCLIITIIIIKDQEKKTEKKKRSERKKKTRSKKRRIKNVKKEKRSKRRSRSKKKEDEYHEAKKDKKEKWMKINIKKKMKTRT